MQRPKIGIIGLGLIVPELVNWMTENLGSKTE